MVEPCLVSGMAKARSAMPTMRPQSVWMESEGSWIKANCAAVCRFPATEYRQYPNAVTVVRQRKINSIGFSLITSPPHSTQVAAINCKPIEVAVPHRLHRVALYPLYVEVPQSEFRHQAYVGVYGFVDFRKLPDTGGEVGAGFLQTRGNVSQNRLLRGPLQVGHTQRRRARFKKQDYPDLHYRQGDGEKYFGTPDGISRAQNSEADRHNYAAGEPQLISHGTATTLVVAVQKPPGDEYAVDGRAYQR